MLSHYHPIPTINIVVLIDKMQSHIQKSSILSWFQLNLRLYNTFRTGLPKPGKLTHEIHERILHIKATN